MKANELRIGNYLDRNGIMEVYQINGKSHSETIRIYDHINHCYINHNFEIVGFKPIPLTEEWLLKFGFFKEEYTWFSKIYKAPIQNQEQQISVNIDSLACAIWDAENESLGYAMQEIKSVHQIQNLYFALTGEELTLNNQP